MPTAIATSEAPSSDSIQAAMPAKGAAGLVEESPSATVNASAAAALARASASSVSTVPGSASTPTTIEWARAPHQSSLRLARPRKVAYLRSHRTMPAGPMP